MRYLLVAVLLLAMAGSAMATQWYAVSDGGYYVKSTPITMPNAQSGIGHIAASGSGYSDAGLVYFFDGSLTLGNLNKVVVSQTAARLQSTCGWTPVATERSSPLMALEC